MCEDSPNRLLEVDFLGALQLYYKLLPNCSLKRVHQFILPSALCVVGAPVDWHLTHPWEIWMGRGWLRQPGGGWGGEGQRNGSKGISLHAQNLSAQKMCKCFPRNKCGPPEDSQHGIILDSVLEAWVEGQTDFSKEHLRVIKFPRGWKRRIHLPCQRNRRWVVPWWWDW